MKKVQQATGDRRQGLRRGAIYRARSCEQNKNGRNELRPYNGGFSLVAVLFLIVVVAALGAFAVRIGAGQQQTVNLALLGARALSAADSGIEFGASRAITSGVCAGSTALTLTGAGLSGFTVDVTCTQITHAATEDPDTTTVYRVGATAYFGTYGQPDYVSRQVYATFSSID